MKNNQKTKLTSRQVLIGLRYLSSNAPLHVLADVFGCCVSTVHNVIARVIGGFVSSVPRVIIFDVTNVAYCQAAAAAFARRSPFQSKSREINYVEKTVENIRKCLRKTERIRRSKHKSNRNLTEDVFFLSAETLPES